MALLLIAFAVMQTIQLRRITRERDRADRVTAFMTGMFKVSNPSEARGNDIRAREILDKSAKDIDTGLANDPELQAQMMNVMGTVYQSLGLTSKAEPLLRRALEIRQRILGPQEPGHAAIAAGSLRRSAGGKSLSRGGEVVPRYDGDSPPGAWPRAS